MRKPKPGFRMYLKTRFKRPLKLPLPLSYDLIYTNEAGDRFKERFSFHTAIFYITVAALVFISLIYLNATIWYYILWIFVLFIFSYLRYFWEEFDLLNENDQPNRIDHKRPGWRKALIVLELLFMVGLPFIVYTAAVDSPYARSKHYIEEGDARVDLLDYHIEHLWQAYDAATDFVEQNAPGSIITEYGIAMYSDGEKIYTLTFRNQTPSIFIRRTYEYDVYRMESSPDYYSGLIWSYWNYDSPYSRFKPIDPPTTEIDTQRIMNILWTNTDLKQKDIEGLYIGTHFFTDLPNLSDPGGDTWAVQVATADTFYYYTVSLTEGTTVLEKTKPIEGE